MRSFLKTYILSPFHIIIIIIIINSLFIIQLLIFVEDNIRIYRSKIYDIYWGLPKGRGKYHLSWNDRSFYPLLENYNNFWLVKTLDIKNPYSRVLLGHITGCNYPFKQSNVVKCFKNRDNTTSKIVTLRSKIKIS